MTAPRRDLLPKLTPQRRRSDTIRRDRLHQILSDTFEYEAVLVSAPAGYGKSTLAVDWCDDCGLPVAWLSLDRQDGDPLTFVANLVAAVRAAFPGALGDLVERLEAGSVPDDAGALIEQFIAGVQREIDDLFFLVLDDLHELESAPETLALLDRLARAVPMSMRLQLLSRSWPELPSLARMIAQRRAFVISAQDLAFTDNESVEFLSRSGIVEAWSQRELMQRADGWAAALAILADHYDPSRGPRHGTAAGSEFVLSDFIEQEILGQLPRAWLDLLSACAVLESFDVALVRELADAPDAQESLRDLEGTNHLLTRLDDDWFRMHSLLREHLLSRLEREDPARLLQLRRSAAAILARRGRRREAVELSIAAEDWAAVVPEVLDLRDELYQRGEWATLTGWLDRLPAEVLDGVPDLSMTRARLATKMLRGQEGLTQLDAIDEAALTVEQSARRELYRAVALRQVGRLSDAIASCRRSRQIALEELPDDAPIVAEIGLEEAVALGQSGQFAASRERFESSAEGFERLADHHRAAEAHDGLGIALFHQGWLAESMREFTAALRRWRMLKEPQAQLRTMNNIGNVQHMLGELDTARDTFHGVIQRARDIGHSRMEAYGREGLAAVERDLGNPETAEALYLLALQDAHELDDPMLVAYTTCGLAMAHRERGQHARAHTLLDHGLRSAEQQNARYLQALFRTGIGATLVSEHRFEEAIPVLEHATAEADETGARREQAIAYLLLAGACFHRRRRAKSTEHLQRVHAIVEELGYDQFLRAEARLLPELIEYGAAKRLGGDYFRTLRGRLDVPAGGAPGAAPGEPTPQTIRAEAFGQPRVTVGGQQVVDLTWRSERSKEMFFYLLHSRRPLRKEQIALELWPDLTPERLNSTFHSTLYRLRRAIDPKVVVQTDHGYEVNSSFDIAYDAREFEEHTRQAEQPDGSSRDRAEHLAAAVHLYRGPFAETFQTQWAQEARRRYEDRYLSCLLTLTAHALQRGEHEEVIALSESIIDVDPLNEQAVQYLMHAHARGGHLDLAARAYRRLYGALQDDLQEEPSEALQRVYQQVLSGALLDSGS